MLTRDDKHQYWRGNRRVWGVTEVLSPYSAFARMNDEAMDIYRERGRAVHKLCELYDKQQLNVDQLDDIGRAYIYHWQRFLEESGFTPALIEWMGYSRTYDYAGQLDRYGVRIVKGREKKILLDIKSGQPERIAGPQMAAYAQLVREEFDDNVEERWCVYLTADFYKIVTMNQAADFKFFAAALMIHNWKLKNIGAAP